MILAILTIFLIVVIAYFKFALPYLKGKSYETWSKLGIFCIYKKVQKDIKDEKLSKAILNFIFSTAEFEKDKKIIEFTNENEELIKKEAISLVSSNPLMHALITQILFVKIPNSNPEMREKIVSNPIFNSSFSNSKFKLYNIHEYAKLVENFAEKEGIAFKEQKVNYPNIQCQDKKT